MSVEQLPENVRKLADFYAKQKAEAPAREPILASTITPEQCKWAWYPYIPAGMISLLGGKGGRGKGQICASFAAAVTKKGIWPDGTVTADRGHVLWCEAEDPLPQVVVPRLIAAGADLDKIHFATADDLAALDLKTFIRKHRVRLIVLSPMLSFMNGLTNHNDDVAVRAVMQALQAAIEEAECAVVGIAHLNKKTDLDAVERLLGSVAFANFVRSVMLVEHDPEADQDADQFRFVLGKHNLAPGGDDLVYRSVNVGEDPRSQYVRLEWSWPSGGNIDTTKLFERKAASERKKSAREWIIAFLEENGPTPGKDVMEAGVAAGYERDALAKAQYRETRIQSNRSGFDHGVWIWSLA
jgi:putative DNA primase/helicase